MDTADNSKCQSRSSSHGAPQTCPRYHMPQTTCPGLENKTNCENKSNCAKSMSCSKLVTPQSCQCCKQIEPQLSDLQKKIDLLTQEVLKLVQDRKHQEEVPHGCCG